MSVVSVSLPDELLFDDLTTPVLDLHEVAAKLDSTQTYDLGDLLLGGATTTLEPFQDQELGGRHRTKSSPGHESIASDVTMDSAIADMLGSPESGEQLHGAGEGAGPSDVADIATIDFDDMLGDENNDGDLIRYLMGDEEADRSSSVGSPESFQEPESTHPAPEPEPVPRPVRMLAPRPAGVATRAGTAASTSFRPPQNPVLLKVVVPNQSVQGSRGQASRGKKGPEGADEDLVEKNKKNAIQAKLNRQKKKAYVEGLEEQVGDLTKENEILKRDSKKMVRDKAALEQEVAYLRSVLANQSALAGLLSNIQSAKNVRFTSSFSRKRSADLDHDYGERSQVPAKKSRKSGAMPALSGGVCLHVDKDDVSIEFCHHCARKAKETGEAE